MMVHFDPQAHFNLRRLSFKRWGSFVTPTYARYP